MSKQMHTPGPWRYEQGRDSRPPYVIRRNEGGFVVVGMSAKRQEADAKAIAAVPDLIEALQGLLDALPSSTTHPAIKAARAALAKASWSDE